MTAPALHHLEDVMGTVVTIDVYTGEPAQPSPPGLSAKLATALATAVATLHRADEVFSTWQPHSPVSRLRRGEITLAQAPPEVAAVLELCAIARDRTDGWFDPWAMPGGVDPTGYVKGWAAQRALAAFHDNDDHNDDHNDSHIAGAIVNAAGDIATFGGLPDGTPFRIGITDPASPRRIAEVVTLTGAIATSGTYERGNHLIDPRSGQPAARVASASVTGPDLGLADALATALAVGGAPVLDLIDALDGYAAFTIGADGRQSWTEHFPFAETLR